MKKCKALTKNGKRCTLEAVFGNLCCPHYRINIDKECLLTDKRKDSKRRKLDKLIYYHESRIKLLRTKRNSLK